MSGWCREESRRGRRLPLIRAVDATCALLADGHPAVLAGTEGEAFTPTLQREYPSLLAGRTDHHIIVLPGPEGTPGWAAVERHLTHAPHPGTPPHPDHHPRAGRRQGREELERVWKAS
ncbi:hypothetical protein ACFZBM_16950 [Streptomyces lavendulae]|uniref:hypothetical protein n=1 Tax=Streptomyces lavendulae TaxID=1914 RepID=UPI0036EBAB09